MTAAATDLTETTGLLLLPSVSVRPVDEALVDVELVTLGVFHPHCVVIEAVGGQGSGDGGP